MKYEISNIYPYLISILIIIMIFFILNHSFKSYESFNNEYDNYHVICANYTKDVSFLDDMGINYTIVDKKTVPNKAHEATSYIYYILKNYDQLPENMIFIHDENESWHHEGKLTENMKGWIKEYESKGKKYYEFNFKQGVHRDTDLYESNHVYRDYYEKCLEPELGSFYEVSPETGQCCAQFIVSRDIVRFRSKEFYERIYNWLINNTEGEGNGDRNNLHSGFYTSRYLEFTWRFIFNGQKIENN